MLDLPTTSKPEIRLLSFLLILSMSLFITGIITPIMTLTKLFFLENSFSILSALRDLWVQNEYFLFIIISLLSVALPIAKILLLSWILNAKYSGKTQLKLLELIHHFGRWAMLDVLVIAILLVAVKLGTIASVEIHYGLYLFAASILITMGVTHRPLTIMQKQAI